MMRAAVAVITVLALTGCAPPTSITPTSRSADTLTLTHPSAVSAAQQQDLPVPSAALGHTVGVRVVLPGDPSTAPSGGWPVVYLLHGSSGSHTDWMYISPNIPALSAAGGVIVVMPDGGAAGYYSDWKSGPKWETFHLSELRAFIKANFPADTTREAIGGFSMGGFGALSYAARHPGRFKAVIALSPVANPLRNPRIVLDDLRAAYPGSVYNLWGNPKQKSSVKIWKKHDPYYLAKGLRSTSLYLYAGKNGGSLENTLRAQTIKLSSRLKKLGLKKLRLTLSIHTGTYGTHNKNFWAPQLTKAWPGMVAALQK